MKKLMLVAILTGGMLILSTLIFAAQLQIGTNSNTTTSNPIYANYPYSYSQQIYTKPQIGAPHSIKITHIRFYYVSGSTLGNSNQWTIYLGHTNKNEFLNTNDWIPITGPTFKKVFEGDISSYVPQTNGQWMDIPLSTPFIYDNVNNLVVAVDENTSGSDVETYWGSFLESFKYNPLRTLYYCGSDDFDPLQPVAGKARTQRVNCLQLIYEENGNPVELTSFFANISNDYYVTLSWIVQSETEMLGYYIFRNNERNLSTAQIVSPLIDATNTSGTHRYEFVDTELYEVGQYYYWLQYTNLDGSFGFHGPIVVQYNPFNNEMPGLPIVTKLGLAYPNPFNPSVNIPFSLGAKADVQINIYNSRGQLIKSFNCGTKDIGNYQIMWDGKDRNGNYCDSGVYHIIMKVGTDTYSQKAVLMK
jgi:hypothetical protein